MSPKRSETTNTETQRHLSEREGAIGRRRPRREPERNCIACRRKGPKTEFLRLRRTPTGEIVLDRSRRAPGRGAYVCPSETCIQKGLNTKTLTRAFRLAAPMSTAQLDALRRALLNEMAQWERVE